MNRGGGRRRQHEDGYESNYFKKRRTSHQDSYNVGGEEDSLRSVILGCGEKGMGSIESSIESAAKMIEGELAVQKAKVLETLTEVITSLPEKCSIYSTLVGLLNAKNYNFGGEFIESVVRSFKEQIKKGEWINAQYSLRYVSDLVNSHVVSATSLLQLYDSLMEVALDTKSTQGRKDWIVYSILNCLPWVGRELYDKKEQTMERLMITINNYMAKRNKKHHTILRVWLTDEPHPQEEYLDCLWAQIEKLKMDGWVEKHILRPYLVFDSILCEALQHKIPQIEVPQEQERGPGYPLPSVVFRMFDYTDCPEGPGSPVLPGAHSIERYLIEQELLGILRKFHEDRKKCAFALLDYPNNQRVPLEYIIVEVIFGELFRLPVSEYLHICYSTILLELCRPPGSVVPAVLAQTGQLLYMRLDTMNVSCVDRYVTWFAYHLSNNQFRWSWDDWARVLDDDLQQPKARFVNEVIQKCIRLSYHERIVDLVPKNFSKLVPPVTDALYKYENQANKLPGSAQAVLIQNAFREKQPIDTILQILSTVPNPLDGDADTHNPLAIQVFCQTLFLLGSKTLTHAHSAVSKYQVVLKRIIKNEESQLCVLKAAFDVYKNDAQTLTVVVNLLLNYQVVEFGSVANWVFTKEMQEEFTKSYLWEILHQTIRKMSQGVAKLSNELNEARELMHSHAEGNSSESESEDRPGKKEPGSAKNPPTEDEVDKMEEKLEAAQADQKNLFLIIFQRFIMTLSEYMAQCDTNSKTFNTTWFQWTIGRLQEVFMQHIDQVYQYSSTLETLLFTQDLDKNILEIFEQFKALKC